MREVAQDVAEVETSHGDFGNDHLQEGGESGEDTELLLVETKTGCGTEVTTLHDAGGNEHFRVFLVDDLQTRGALEIALTSSVFTIICFTSGIELTVNNHDLLRSLLLREGVEDQVDGLAENDTVGANLLRAADVQVGNRVGLDVVKNARSHVLGVAACGEVLQRALDRNDIVAVSAALNVRYLEAMPSASTMD